MTTTPQQLVDEARYLVNNGQYRTGLNKVIDVVGGILREKAMAEHPSAQRATTGGAIAVTQPRPSVRPLASVPFRSQPYGFGGRVPLPGVSREAFDEVSGRLSFVEAEKAALTSKLAESERRNEILRAHLVEADQRIVNQREQLSHHNKAQSIKVSDLTNKLAEAQQESAGLRQAMPLIQTISDATKRHQALILNKLSEGEKVRKLVLAAFPPFDSQVVKLGEYRDALAQLRAYADQEHAKGAQS